MALRRAIGEFLLGQEALRCFIARGPLRRGQKQCSPFWPWRASRLIRALSLVTVMFPHHNATVPHAGNAGRHGFSSADRSWFALKVSSHQVTRHTTTCGLSAGGPLSRFGGLLAPGAVIILGGREARGGSGGCREGCVALQLVGRFGEEATLFSAGGRGRAAPDRPYTGVRRLIGPNSPLVTRMVSQNALAITPPKVSGGLGCHNGYRHLAKRRAACALDRRQCGGGFRDFHHRWRSRPRAGRRAGRDTQEGAAQLRQRKQLSIRA